MPAYLAKADPDIRLPEHLARIRASASLCKIVRHQRLSPETAASQTAACMAVCTDCTISRMGLLDPKRPEILLLRSARQDELAPLSPMSRHRATAGWEV